MPLTAAERMKKRREKLKQEGKYEDYKKKNAEDSKKSRKKKKQALASMSTSKKIKALKEQRINVRQRVAKHRHKKNFIHDSEASTSSSSAITPQALGKATSRVEKVLPKSDEKAKLVLKKLLDKYDVNNPACEVLRKERTSGLSDTILSNVAIFYERDDISRQAPGLRDFVTVCNENGQKEKKQIRHLYASVRETHALFVKEFGDVIGKSKFADLRPKHVYLSSKLPHNVCLCKYHENFNLALSSLHSSIKSPKYDHNFINTFICESPKQECWLRTCDQCKGFLKSKLEECVEKLDSLPPEINWYVWKDCENGKLSKVQETGTVIELIQHILSMALKFFEHVYIKRHQANTYIKYKEFVMQNSIDAVAFIQVDYSENFTCIAQDEIQSFHWVQPQITLFTVSLWLSGKQHPIVIVSDNRQHDKTTAIIYIDRILKELPEFVKIVHIWSDGPASQFKNRFVAESLKLLERRNGVHIIWNYFATSHGKGPVDGIGGSLKRFVRGKVMKRQSIVLNANQFVIAANDSSVRTINVTPSEIEETTREMGLESLFSNAPSLPGISKCHVLYWLDGILKKSLISDDFDDEINMELTKVLAPENMSLDTDDSEDDDDIPLAVIKARKTMLLHD